MVQLQTSLKELEATGGQVVGISFDSADVLKRFATKSAITFPLLSDAGSKTIDAYGVRNKEAPERWKGLAYPGTFIVGTNGVIRAKLFLEGYKDRHSIDALVQALKAAR